MQVHFFDVLKNAAAKQAGRNMANKISGRARIEIEAEKLTEPIAVKHGVRIYDVEYVKEGPEY